MRNLVSPDPTEPAMQGAGSSRSYNSARQRPKAGRAQLEKLPKMAYFMPLVRRRLAVRERCYQLESGRPSVFLR